MVTTESKKEFIEWFNDKYEFERRECIWLLKLIISDDKILKKVKFVRNAKYYPHGIILSTKCTNEDSFRYYNQSKMTTNTGNIAHEICTKDVEFHIQLNFTNEYPECRYFDLLEDDERNQEYIRDMDNFIDKLLNKGKIEVLKSKIDKALDDSDEEEFYKLTSELNRVTV